MRYLQRATTEKGFIDLHNHTNLSYGHEMGEMNIMPLDFLEEMREYADKFNQVVTFSITDHNDIIANFKIINEIHSNPKKYKNIRYISGAEYSVSTDSLGVCYDENGKEQPIIQKNRMHLLAYGFDVRNPDIQYLNMLMSTSNKFAMKIDYYDNPLKQGNIIFATQRFLKSKGILKGISDFRQYCPLQQNSFKDTLALVEKYLSNVLTLDEQSMAEWKSFIGNNRNLMKNTKADVMEVMSIVEKAGGYSVLAHPLAYIPSDAFQAICRSAESDPRNKQYVDISFDDKNYKSMSASEKGKNLRRMENYFDFLYRKLSIEAKNPITGEKIQGIIGHELIHPLNQTNPYKFQTILKVGDKYGLYCTGGSDSHGDYYTYCFPSRVVGGMVQKYDSNYDPKVAAYCLHSCEFVNDYFASKQINYKLDRQLGREAKKQIIILKTSENGEIEYDINKFLEVVFASFERKKEDKTNGNFSDEYDIAEQETQQL